MPRISLVRPITSCHSHIWWTEQQVPLDARRNGYALTHVPCPVVQPGIGRRARGVATDECCQHIRCWQCQSRAHLVFHGWAVLSSHLSTSRSTGKSHDGWTVTICRTLMRATKQDRLEVRQPHRVILSGLVLSCAQCDKRAQSWKTGTS